MSEYLRDQLSAFIDGELPKPEIELLFKRLDGNAELRATLARYTVIGETLRTRNSEGPSRSFAQRVRAAVQADGPLSGRRAMSAIQRRWLKPVAGLGVAATVAAVALLGLQRLQNPALDPATPMVARNPAEEMVLAAPLVTQSPSYTVPAPASANSLVAAARLTNYVVAHSEYSSPFARRNVLLGIVAESPAPVEASATDEASVTAPMGAAVEK